MKYPYHLLLGMLLVLAVQGCTERLICPAYQSAFIHDEEALRKRFSYFNEDSTPKVLEASKNKYLLIEPVSYRRKLRSLQTIPMVDVYYEEEDSLAFDDEFLLAERDVRSRDLYDSADLVKDHSLPESVTDSLSADTTYVISVKKEDFNIDQELYLWYLRKYLVYPDVRIEQQENIDPETLKAAQKKKRKERKGIRGFFQRLFSKKDQEEEATESGELAEANEEELETSATELEEGETEKKGLFSFLKKGNKPPKQKKEKKPKVKREKKKKKEAPPQEAPEPEPEDEDEGEDDF